MLYDFPTYTRGERLVDGCIHVVGIAASIAAVVAIVVAASNGLPALAIVSLAIYGFGMVAVFACSAGYNFVSEPRWKSLLRRFDHAAIYVKIAGTYTPFAMVKMGDAVGFTLLGAVWAVTLFGATLKLVWPTHLIKTSYVLYLAQGWAIVAALQPLSTAVSTRVLVLLAVGGVLYTVGVVFHLSRRLPYHNAIWHAFVLAGSACHFAAIIDAIALSRST